MGNGSALFMFMATLSVARAFQRAVAPQRAIPRRYSRSQPLRVSSLSMLEKLIGTETFAIDEEVRRGPPYAAWIPYFGCSLSFSVEKFPVLWHHPKVLLFHSPPARPVD